MRVETSEELAQINDVSTPQVVLVTDKGFLKPTLFTLWSLLRHLTVPAIVHFWGDNLTERDWVEVRLVA